MSQHSPSRFSSHTRRPAHWRASVAQLLIALLVIGAGPGTAWSNPSGADVVAGEATIEKSGSQTTIHAADRTVIDWQDFDIGVNESVRFIQPDELSRVLNRVVTPHRTQIDGKLSANGRVYILNPYGIYFGETAIVNVGELVAGAGNLSTNDFLNGVDRFSELGGRVENLGAIHADAVRLFGASVANHGLISAPDGAIWLLAGDEVVVAEHGSPIVVRLASQESAAQPAAQAASYGVENTGTLDARRGSVRMAAGDLLSLAVRNTGTIRADRIALAGGELGRVQVEGTLDATSPEGVGGEVDVRGDVVVVEGARIDASGSSGGGQVHIGGGWQGEHEAGERNARLTYVDADSDIRADARERGDGGEVVIWSDRNAHVHGQLSARGGSEGGNGGRIETSGKWKLDVTSNPDLSAPRGDGGLWLLDPSNIRIVTNADATVVGEGMPFDFDRVLDTFFDQISDITNVGPRTVAPVVDDSLVSASSIAGALSKGFNVTLTTQNIATGGTEEGNITFEVALDFGDESSTRPSTRATFRLLAANKITLNTGATITDRNSPQGDFELSLELVAGDTGQPLEPGFTPLDGIENQRIVADAPIDIRGSLTAQAASILLNRGVSAKSIDLNATRGEILVSSPNAMDPMDPDGIAVRTLDGIAQLQTTFGLVDVTPQDMDDLDEPRGNIAITGDIDITGGADISGELVGLIAVAGGGNVIIDGAIDTTGSGTEGSTIAIAATLGVITDENGDPSPTDSGNLALSDSNAMTGERSYTTGGGDVELRATDSITLSAAIDSGGGTVDVLADPSDPDIDIGARSIAINNDIVSAGGEIAITGTDTASEDGTAPETIDVTIGQDVVLDASLAGEHGAVSIQTIGSLTVESGATIRGGEVRLASGILDLGASVTGNLTFMTGTMIEASSVELEAGDGYTVALIDDDPGTGRDASIDYSTLTIGPVGTAPDELLTSLRLLQDASVGPGELPSSAAVTLAPGADSRIQIAARDGSLDLDADASTLLSEVGPDGTAALELAGGDPGISLGQPLSAVGAVEILVAEDFTVAGALTANLVNATDVEITSGIQSREADTATNEQAVAGDLRIDTPLEGKGSIELHGGAGGIGDLIVSARLQATDSISLRAGDGTGGFTGSATNDIAQVEIDVIDPVDPTLRFDITTDDFTVRQDAAIGGAGSPIRPLTATPQRYTLRSDDSSVTLADDPDGANVITRAALAGTDLVIAANSIDSSAFASDPLSVLGLDLGGIGNLTVTNALLDGFTFDQTEITARTTELVLRAGIAQNGTLSLNTSANQPIEGDVIRLIASDGPGGNIGSVILNIRTPQFTRPGAPTEAPTTFIMEQDTDVTDGSLPGASQFGDGSETGSALPSNFAARSADATLSLVDVADVPVDPTGEQVFGGPVVVITADDGTLTLDTETEIRANQIALQALATDGSVELDTAALTLAGHDTAEGGVDAGDFQPFLAGNEATVAPEVALIRQGADLSGANLPMNPFVSSTPAVGDATLYQLISTNGSVRVDDAGKVAGTFLNPLLEGDPDSFKDDDGTPLRTLDVGREDGLQIDFDLFSLLIDHPRDLTIGSNVTIVAQDAVQISAGLTGVPGEGLTFDTNTRIEALDVTLRAGSPEFVDLETDPPELAVVDARKLTIAFSDAESTLEITQDGAFFERGNPLDWLPATLTPSGPIASLDLRSRRSDLAIQPAQFDYAADVELVAGDFLLPDPDDPDAVPKGLLVVSAETDDLDFDNMANLEKLTLAGNEITLKALDSGARVLAGSDKLLLRGATLASPSGFTIEQSAPLDNDPATGNLAQTSQFESPNLLGLPYTVRSIGNDFTVDKSLADQLSVFSLTLDSGDTMGTITLTANTTPGDANTAPEFIGFAGIAQEIAIATERFDTIFSQDYQGRVTLMDGVVANPEDPMYLGSLIGGIEFTGPVVSETSGVNSLDLTAALGIVFAEGVGVDAATLGDDRLMDLTVNFNTSLASVDFGLGDGTTNDTSILLDGNLAVLTINFLDYQRDRSEATPIVRNPAPTVASIFKRNEGTLFVEADNVLIGGSEDDGTLLGGEKWTTVGDLEIVAQGEVRLGDVTAQAVRIQGDHLTLVQRARSTLLRSDGGSDGDAGVDWVANIFEITLTDQQGLGMGLDIAPGVRVAGNGARPVVGTIDGQPVEYTLGGVPDLLLPFSSARIHPDGGQLLASDLLFGLEADGFVLDSRPRGPAGSDFSRVLTEALPGPRTPTPHEPALVDPTAFRDIGIETRPPTARESVGRERAAAILDDASRGWRTDGPMVHIAASRLDVVQASEAETLFNDVFGVGMENAPAIQLVLGGAVADYRSHTGARHVLGFELRRFLRNRPSTQYEAYHLLGQLDRLFSAHRRSGLVPAEYQPVQQAWAEAITPVGIDTSELAQAIHPSRYVRGSDVLDVFGD